MTENSPDYDETLDRVRLPIPPGLRFMEIMRRHCRSEDKALTDDAFVRAVFKRYEDGRAEPLIDPNE